MMERHHRLGSRGLTAHPGHAEDLVDAAAHRDLHQGLCVGREGRLLLHEARGPSAVAAFGLRRGLGRAR